MAQVGKVLYFTSNVQVEEENDASNEKDSYKVTKMAPPKYTTEKTRRIKSKGFPQSDINSPAVNAEPFDQPQHGRQSL